MATRQPPSTSFGTRTIRLERTISDPNYHAVLTVCFAARDRGIEEIRTLLEILGLDPAEERSKRGDVTGVE